MYTIKQRYTYEEGWGHLSAGDVEPCVAGVAGDGRDGATHMSRAATAGVIPGWMWSVTIYWFWNKRSTLIFLQVAWPCNYLSLAKNDLQLCIAKSSFLCDEIHCECQFEHICLWAGNVRHSLHSSRSSWCMHVECRYMCITQVSGVLKVLPCAGYRWVRNL